MYDVAIVGGGTAGASAATFTARAGLQTVVIDADAGMTRRAMVNNHLGFPEGVKGPDLVDNGKMQAARAGAEIVDGKIVTLDKRSNEGFELKTEDGKSFEAKQVILTLGANAELAKSAGVALSLPATRVTAARRGTLTSPARSPAQWRAR